MALLLRHEDVRKTVDMADAIDAMEQAFAEEANGGALLPQRINVKAGRGWLRVGPVVLEQSGIAGFKAMNLAAGQGVRYQVHLYRVATGELLSIMDAQHLTTLRTGATSVVATRRLARKGPAVVALLGSGAEARAQLEALQVAGYVASARVFSPTKGNREKLADYFRIGSGMQIVAVDSAEEAVRGSEMVVAAVKSATPALQGSWLRPGMHVVSVGTARQDQREIDEETFRRSDRIVVDTRRGVFEEAGDAVAAREFVAPERVHELCELVGNKGIARTSDDQITLFKSVGTGIQDLALAGVIYERARQKGIGSELGEFPYLKQN
jgi:ornithine cyclodeaminase/alanine dehydrogenase-like protein (mu-crystallin family)